MTSMLVWAKVALMNNSKTVLGRSKIVRGRSKLKQFNVFTLSCLSGVLLDGNRKAGDEAGEGSDA